jgi:hypothetical protein
MACDNVLFMSAPTVAGNGSFTGAPNQVVVTDGSGALAGKTLAPNAPMVTDVNGLPSTDATKTLVPKGTAADSGKSIVYDAAGNPIVGAVVPQVGTPFAPKSATYTDAAGKLVTLPNPTVFSIMVFDPVTGIPSWKAPTSSFGNPVVF